MAQALIYPTNRVLRTVAAIKAANLEARRMIFTILPIDTLDNHTLEWEQEDDYTGLQQVRGLNGRPPRVQHVGAKRYVAEPGVYGEHMVIDEQEITKRRNYGQLTNAAIDVNDLVAKRQDRLLARRYDRIEQLGWLLLTTGTFSVSAANGAILHTDTYVLNTYTAGVTWATSATAVPLKNFRDIQLLSRGKGVSFGANARAIMNRVTFNRLVSNTNVNDMAGRRTSGLLTVLNLTEINGVLLGEGLPQIEIYDEGYKDDAGTFVPYIGDGKVLVVGVRTDGGQIGNYLMTRNANNPNSAPGAYQKIIDKGEEQVPREIEIHDGHNGGAVLYYPSAMVVMNV
jgi:hypothetical protein